MKSNDESVPENARKNVHWWDRGRARWRSRPENKERSYGEYVGGKRRPARPSNSGERSAVRNALGEYRGASDERRALLDERASYAERKGQWRWKHTQTRRDVLERTAERREQSYGRKFAAARGFYAPTWAMRRAFESAGVEYTDATLKSISDALGALLGSIRWTATRRSSYARWILRSEAFCEAIPAMKLRRKIAAICSVAMDKYLRSRGRGRFALMLWAICSDDGRLASRRARHWRLVLGISESFLWYRGQASDLRRRVQTEFRRSPTLADRFTAWMMKH